MKFMMIFEGIDRASKVMAKIMNAEKKAAASVKAGSAASVRGANDAARAAGRQASALQRVGSIARGAYNSVASGARAAGRAMDDLHRRSVKLGKAGFGQVREGAGKAMRGAALAGGLLVSVFGGAAIAATHLTATGSQFEKFQTILETTEGSSAKAGKAMSWVSDFAAKTPYELDGVMDSFVQLRSNGLDPTNGLLKALGDTSAAMGKPLMQGVEAMADAVTGENERLKEFGITASKTGNKIAYTYTNAAGKQMTASVKATDRMAIQLKLMEIFNEKYGGAMEKLSGTWDGMVSNLADSWSRFQLMIMNAGLFDWMKTKLAFLLDTVNAMAADGTLQAWAQMVSDRIVLVLETAWTFAQGVWSVLQRLASVLSVAADAVGGWENLAIVLGSIAFGATLISTAAGIVQIAIGLSMLATAMAGLGATAPLLAAGAAITRLTTAMRAMGLALLVNPVFLAIAALVGGAALVYMYWEPIKAFFVDLWPSIAAGASKAWDAIKTWLGIDPLAALSSGWSAIAAKVSEAWKSLPKFTWPSLPSFSWPELSGFQWPTLPAFSWPTLASFNWPSLPSFSWPELSGFQWPTLPTFSWPTLASFRWPSLPDFRWPTIPKLTLPNLPDVGVWMGRFADRATEAIEKVSARLGTAWASVKSAFSFGEETASLTVSNPETIKAAAAAAATLKADMQLVAGIKTDSAMKRLAELEAAAKQVGASVMSSIRQAQAFVANTSFYNQGAALMDTMAAGIRARAAVVVNEIQKMAQQIRDHLPSSPAKVGPLSDIHRLKFGETIASSIRAEPMVKAMRTAAAATMAAAAMSAPAFAQQAAAPLVAFPDRAAVARDAVARASVQARPKEQAPAGGISLNFAPVLHAGAGTDVKNIEAEFDRMMRDGARKMADLLDEEQRRRARRET